MKHLSPAIICLLLISFFFFYACPKAVEPPKPRASISVDVQDESNLDFAWNGWTKSWYANFTVIVSESNGVGGRVTICKLEFSDNGAVCSTATYSGGSFSGYGTCEIYCTPEVPERCNFDKLTIIVSGADNNGYSFEKTISYTYGSSMNFGETKNVISIPIK